MAEPAVRPAGTGPKVPLGRREEWPVPWQAVVGTADGIGPRLVAFLAQSAFAVAARLPQRVLDLLLGALSRLGRRFDRRHADAARAFLQQALGPLPQTELEERVLQSFRHFLRVAVDTHRFPRLVAPENWPERFDVEWTDDMLREIRAGTGCVVVTCHVGSWEAALAAMPVVGFDPAYGIAKPVKNRPLSVSAQREREERGVRLLPRRGAMSLAPEILRAGGSIGMVLDQRANQRPVLAPFFGRPARCDRSAAVLLRRLGAPVFVMATYLAEEPLHYRIECFDRLLPVDVAGMGTAEIVARINSAFERMILKHPEQYFWLHDRYKDTPEAFPVELGAEEGGESSAGSVSSERDPSSTPEVPKA